MIFVIKIYNDYSFLYM